MTVGGRQPPSRLRRLRPKLAQQRLGPLGMDNTATGNKDPHEAFQPRVAAPEDRDGQWIRREIRDADAQVRRWCQQHASMRDKWLRLQLANGVFNVVSGREEGPLQEARSTQINNLPHSDDATTVGITPRPGHPAAVPAGTSTDPLVRSRPVPPRSSCDPGNRHRCSPPTPGRSVRRRPLPPRTWTHRGDGRKGLGTACIHRVEARPVHEDAEQHGERQAEAREPQVCQGIKTY